jgi:hypothetical protein
MSSPEALTQEQVVSRGVSAKLLLSDARFQSFFEETGDLILQSIANTTPENSAEREVLYFRYNALRDLTGIMQSYVDAAEAILKLQDIEKEID